MRLLTDEQYFENKLLEIQNAELQEEKLELLTLFNRNSYSFATPIILDYIDEGIGYAQKQTDTKYLYSLKAFRFFYNFHFYKKIEDPVKLKELSICLQKHHQMLEYGLVTLMKCMQLWSKGAIEQTFYEINEAIDFLQDKEDNEGGLAHLYMIMGIFNFDLDDLEKSKSYYNQCLKLLGDKQYLSLKCYSTIGLASIAKKHDDLDKALFLLKRTYDLSVSSPRIPNIESRSLLEMGLIHFQQKQNTKALQYLRESLAIRLKVNFYDAAVSSYTAIAEVLMHENNLEEATFELKEALSLCEKNNLSTKKIDLYEKLSEIAHHNQNYKDAYEYLIKKQALEKSIFSSQKENKLQTLTYKYEAQKAHKESEFKSFFLANVSHEIRTPLNGIVGMIDVLDKSTNLDKNEREIIEIVKQSSSHLLNILNDLLDLSKIEAKQMQIEKEVIDPISIFNSVVNLHKVNAENKGLQLNCNYLRADFPYILADASKLVQVLNNLLSNAIKFTEYGFVKLSVGFEPIEDNRINMHLEVEDSGIGISEHMIYNLFNEFYQVKQNSNNNIKGTGLGLFISNRIVKLMGGEAIKVSSTIGKGSKFWFNLCFDTASEMPLKVHENNIEPSPNNYHFLVVDDNKINLKVAGIMLKKMGIEASFANSGKEAVQLVQSNVYDLILMDIQMPDIDGIEAMKIIKNTNVAPPPIVALSANVLESQVQSFLEQGMDDYLSKPLTLQELDLIVRKWLD